MDEIFGVHGYIHDICRFAKRSYLAVAPKLYIQQSDVPQLPDIDEIIRTVATTAPSAR